METAEHAGQVAIIIPTMDNRPYLEPCIRSLLLYTAGVDFRVYVVNNGAPESCAWLDDPRVTVIAAGGNLGWERGLACGLSCSSEPLVLFLNDDTLFVPACQDWLAHMASLAELAEVGAVGPTSNCVAGMQSIACLLPATRLVVPYLIGFCLLVRRSTLDAVGGIDTTLPGGDDIDLSIRLRQAGYALAADRHVFVYHHGFVTGTRVHGNHLQPGGWNSPEMTRRTLDALIAKHGREAVQQLWG